MCPKISDCTCFSDRAFKGRRPCFTTPMMSQKASLIEESRCRPLCLDHLGVQPSGLKGSPVLQVVPLCSYLHSLNAQPRCMRFCGEILFTQLPIILENAPKNVDVTAYSRTFFRIEDFYAFRNRLQGFYTSKSRFWAFKGIERKLRNYRNTFRTIDSLADRLVDPDLQISEHLSG